MNKLYFSKIACLAILIFSVFSTGCSHTYAADNASFTTERKAINVAIDAYANTYVTEDDRPLIKVMAHDADRISIGTDENEYFEGWETVLARFRLQFGRLEKTSVTIKRREIKIHKSGKVAWFSQIWDMDTVANGTHNLDNGMRLTGVLEKRGNDWKIVQYHNSAPKAH